MGTGIRTASVTALTEAQLVTIEREAFLVAVTGHGETALRVDGLVSGRLLELDDDVRTA